MKIRGIAQESKTQFAVFRFKVFRFISCSKHFLLFHSRPPLFSFLFLFFSSPLISGCCPLAVQITISAISFGAFLFLFSFFAG